MKTLQFYLMRQVLATLVMTVGVFTGVLLLGSLAKEMLPLLVDENVNLWMVLNAIGMLIPFILVFALPIGMLTATLLVFGRLSTDQELTAMRASGISLVSLVSPVLLFSILMSIVCGMINLDYAPRARHSYRVMLEQLMTANIGFILPAGTFIELSDYTIYIGGYSSDGDPVDIRIYQMKNGKVATSLGAERAAFDHDSESGEIRLTLFEGHQVGYEDGRTFFFGELPLARPLQVGGNGVAFEEASVSNMSLPALFQKCDELQTAGIDATPVIVQIHSKIAFSLACVGFTLIGIPLGLQSHRRETRMGILLSLVLISVYYGFFIFAEAQASNPGVKPYLFVWIPNLLFQVVGGVLLYRADHSVR